MNVSFDYQKFLSYKRQYSDITVIRRTKYHALIQVLPACLENLSEHRLIYKSPQESLDEWTITQLITFDCDSNKLVSPSLENLLPVDQFQLYVSTP